MVKTKHFQCKKYFFKKYKKTSENQNDYMFSTFFLLCVSTYIHDVCKQNFLLMTGFFGGLKKNPRTKKSSLKNKTQAKNSVSATCKKITTNMGQN